jgi:hypothetical protein
MLKKLRIGPKLLLAPGLVLIMLIVTAGSAYYGMVRQNASLENLVQVRAARLKAAADVSGCWRGSTAASPRPGSMASPATSTASMRRSPPS